MKVKSKYFFVAVSRQIVFSVLFLFCMEALADSIAVPVINTNDDAEEKISTGEVMLGGTQYEMMVDGSEEQIIGLRFQNLNIPGDANIIDAYIQFYGDDSPGNAEAVTISIEGELNAASAAFSSTQYDISSRQTTTASVSWSPGAWGAGVADNESKTPSVSSIVQEIISLEGWQNGNPVSFILSKQSGSGLRIGETFDGVTGREPVLHIEYSTGTNLALNKNVYCSSSEGVNIPSKAVDNDTSSRWGSSFSDNEWFMVDLGDNYQVDKVVIDWESAYGAQYDIEVSQDSVTWHNAAHITDGSVEKRVIEFNMMNARYIKFKGIARGTSYGYSFYEFEVYGNGLAEDYSTWDYSTRVFLNTKPSGADVAGNVTGFPLLLRLDRNNFNFDLVKSGGEDIRFATSTGSSLFYEIEHWDIQAKEAVIWVLVPEITGNDSTQYIEMFWGKSDAESRSDGKNVFTADNNLVSVWHFGSVNDASSNSNDLTKSSSSSPVVTEGIAGSAFLFNGLDDHCVSGRNPSYNIGSSFSVSGWFKYTDTTAPQGWQRIISTKPQWSDNQGFEITLQNDDDDALEVLAYGSTSLKLENAVNSWTDGSWQYVTVLFNGTQVSIYVNGAFVGSGTVSAVSNSSSDVVIGCNASLSESRFKGIMDEVRIRNSVPSSDRIKLSYENQREDQSLVTFENNYDVPQLSGMPLSRTSIELQWSYEGNADEFVLEAKNNTSGCGLPECTDWQVIYQGDLMNYLHSGLTCSTPWLYRVKVYGSDIYSDILSVSTVSCDSIVPPYNVSVSALSESSMNISWEGDLFTGDRYVLQAKMNGTGCSSSNACTFFEIYSGTGNSFTHHNMPCNTQWEYRVKTILADGTESTWSRTASGTTGECSIAAPGGLAADNSIPREITLYWTDNAVNETGYRVYRKNEGEQEFNTAAASLPENTNMYTDTNLECNTGYSYTVQAFNDSLNSQFSNIVETATLYCGAGKNTAEMITLIGIMLNEQGEPFTGDMPAVVKLYGKKGGDVLYEEYFEEVRILNGFVSIPLGLNDDITDFIRSNRNLYYDILIGGSSIFDYDPRPLTASPYAIRNDYNLHGEGPATNVPAPVGATYVDTESKDLYIKYGTDNSDWHIVGY